MTKTQHNFRPELQAAIKAASLGRAVLMSYFGNLEHVSEKLMAGLVSEADKESEKVIQSYLKSQFPEYGFLGEESASEEALQEASKDKKGIWIVDPLDGTTNYIHRMPIFCISIGLMVEGVIEVAVIDVPILQETYTALRGGGSFVNGRALKIGQAKNLKESLLCTGFFGENEPLLVEQLEIFSYFVRRCRGVRRLGAAAYDLCLVARGVLDLFWERNLKPWDTSAGLLLVREAGGVVKTYKGLDYDPFKNSLAAGNPTVVNEFLTHVNSISSPDSH